MRKRRMTTDAHAILHHRYIKGDPTRQASLQAERDQAAIARLIYDLRTGAGLSQRALAERIGTTQSVISRLEDAEYRGQSLSMLTRIAKALGYTVTVSVSEVRPRSAARHVTR